jgi:TolA-binding protein
MRIGFAAALVAALLGTSTAASAQTAIEGRVDRLEREMRAVQRKVFPGGAGQTIEPQITAPTSQNVPGVPASSQLTDLTARLNAIEAQQTTLTGQVEQMQFRLKQVEDGFNAYRRSTDARLKALEETTSAVGNAVIVPPSEATAPKPTTKPVAGGTGGPAVKPPATTPAAGAKPTPAKADPVRAATLGTIEKPASDDPAEDGYIYGYRLWQAKLYPEARTALKDVATKYPKHRRASYAQNLLGRAYLDAGAPSLAAVAFYENFKKNPEGERAPESLYYLAQSLTQLKKPAAEVCKVYGELNDLYADRMGESLKAQVAEGRAAAKCK